MVAHRHEAVQAAGRVECNTHNDQQAGTAQLDAHTGQVAEDDRQYSHRSQEDRADEGDLVQGAGQEIAGRLAGTEAGCAAWSICKKLPIVPGIETRAEAKMMGMTPLMFSFSGR